MGEKYKAFIMDWLSAGDLNQRFKLFKQKCNLIFDGLLTEKKTRLKSACFFYESTTKVSKSTTLTILQHPHMLSYWQEYGTFSKPTSNPKATKYLPATNYGV